MATQRNKRDRAGRPRKTAQERKRAERQREEDSGRLQQTLWDLGLSQAEVERRTGIRQSWISDIINRNRDFTREDLRRLALIGISADYLLGVTKELIPPGQSRTRAELEFDLAIAIERELQHLYPPSVTGSEEAYGWKVSGSGAFRIALDGIAAQAAKALADESERKQTLADIRVIVESAGHVLNSLPAAATEAIEAAVRLIKITDKMSKRVGELKQKEANVLLVPQDLLDAQAQEKKLSS